MLNNSDEKFSTAKHEKHSYIDNVRISIPNFEGNRGDSRTNFITIMNIPVSYLQARKSESCS